MRARGQTEPAFTWRPPHLEADITELLHQIELLALARFAHDPEGIHDAARRMIQPVVRLASGGLLPLREKNMATIAQLLSEYLYYTAEALPRRASDAVLDAMPLMSDLAESANREWAILDEDILREQDQAPGPDDEAER